MVDVVSEPAAPGRQSVSRIQGRGLDRFPIDLTFVIEPARIRFFAEFLGRSLTIDEHVSAARALAPVVVASWASSHMAAARALTALGVSTGLDRCLVSVLPADFAIGASHTRDSLILYGQPERSPGFAAAVLVHELAHIGLARRAPTLSTSQAHLSSIAAEALCFLTEAHVHSQVGRRNLRDVWQASELDDFHRLALDAALEVGGDIVTARTAADEARESVEVRLETILAAAGPVSKPADLLSVLRTQESDRSQ